MCGLQAANEKLTVPNNVDVDRIKSFLTPGEWPWRSSAAEKFSPTWLVYYDSQGHIRGPKPMAVREYVDCRKVSSSWLVQETATRLMLSVIEEVLYLTTNYSLFLPPTRGGQYFIETVTKCRARLSLLLVLASSLLSNCLLQLRISRH